MKKALNLYAGLGGNREKWDGWQITAVEHDPILAYYYQYRYPQDRVFVGDALQFAVEKFDNYDFIWGSPPCPTHGQYRFNVGVRGKGFAPVMPDMTSLYGLIIFLKNHYNGLWAIENTVPYYSPLIEPTAKVGRHLIWANFSISDLKIPSKNIRSNNSIASMEAVRGISLVGWEIKNKRQKLRNCTSAEVSEHIFDAVEAMIV